MHNRVVLLSTVLASAPSSKSRGASEQLEGGKWRCIDGAVQRRTCLDMLMQKKEDSECKESKAGREEPLVGACNIMECAAQGYCSIAL